MLKRILTVLLLAATLPAAAQTDTFRIAAYNLLHYGRPQANRYALKNTYLQPILATLKPTIIGFNEIDTTVVGVLDTINTVMPAPMQHGAVHNTTNTDILDALFWKTGKFKWLRDTIICNYLRDIVAYDLYYDDPQLGITHDTVKIKVITAHLKSSNAVADRTVRDTETRRVMRYLDRLTDTLNIVMMGDFNLYRSSEAAYQNLTAGTNALSRLNDPLHMPGDWDGTASFAAIHTQSPRLVQLADQGASGGLDSRFDFVLLSDAIMKGWKGMRYIPGTYAAFGNDGQHFNKALTDAPAHPALSAAMIQALYSNSDHLPVSADIAITPPAWNGPPPSGVAQAPDLRARVRIANPFGSEIRYQLMPGVAGLHYRLMSIEGATLQAGTLDGGVTCLPVPALAPGIYFMRVSDQAGAAAVWRLCHE